MTNKSYVILSVIKVATIYLELAVFEFKSQLLQVSPRIAFETVLKFPCILGSYWMPFPNYLVQIIHFQSIFTKQNVCFATRGVIFSITFLSTNFFKYIIKCL